MSIEIENHDDQFVIVEAVEIDGQLVHVEAGEYEFTMDDNLDSIEEVRVSEVYPKKPFHCDDNCNDIPFNLLSGEGGLYRGHTTEGVLILTNYRAYHSKGTFFNMPLGLIDYVEAREIFYLYIYCKDARSFRCTFENNDETQKWLKRFQTVTKVPEKLDNNFAFVFYSWTKDEQQREHTAPQPEQLPPNDVARDTGYNDFLVEAERMGFNMEKVWKISRVNEKYELCPSYPRYFIVPTSVSDDQLKDLASYRYSRRIPAVVWRHQKNGCVIIRSSQPRVGIMGWRNSNDEELVRAIADACVSDQGTEAKANGNAEEEQVLPNDMDIHVVYGQNEQNRSRKKFVFVDARSFAIAWTNRAKGGGYEHEKYVPDCYIQFMGLANIHVIRSSFIALRTLCATPEDPNWLCALDATKWLHHISGIIKSAVFVVNAVHVERMPVLVHCSDGWDRTPQIVALAELMLDPYYRTKKGFQVLVEKEWLQFGHKFADRCGHSNCMDDYNERSPVFLQWLDCVYQLLHQYQCHFEFNQAYIARLALHTYSGLFGTFLCNTDQDRRVHSINSRTFSIWPVLNKKSHFHNNFYEESNEVLQPSWLLARMKFWEEVYLPNNPSNLTRIAPPDEGPIENGEKKNLVKTKSCDNISSVDNAAQLQRRKSDPSLLEKSFVDTNSNPESNHDKFKTVHDLLDRVPNALSTLNFGDSSERTANVISNSNLVLREPTTNGSTDTLVSERGAHKEEPSDIFVMDLSPSPRSSRSIGTNTSPSSERNAAQNAIDSNMPSWGLLHGACIFSKRNSNASNSYSCSSYTTPNHSRTPSSGFPATPSDDPNDVPPVKEASALHQIFDVDGLIIETNPIQDRVRKILLHYKNKVRSLQYELSAAKCEFLHQMCRYYQNKEGRFIDVEDGPSVAESLCSGERPAESGGSDGSWDILWTTENGATNYGM